MVTTSNIDAILGTCLYYYKVFIVVLKFKFNWHLVLSFEKSDRSNLGDLWVDKSQWPTPINTVTARLQLGEKEAGAAGQ